VDRRRPPTAFLFFLGAMGGVKKPHHGFFVEGGKK